jgi:hypothetical protein
MTAKKMYKCGVGDCTYEHERSQTVGVHRRRAHGILGKHLERDRKSLLKKIAKTKTSALTSTGKDRMNVHQEKEERFDPQEVVVAYTIGRIEELILSAAVKHDFAPKQFARRCIEYLSHTKVR